MSSQLLTPARRRVPSRGARVRPVPAATPAATTFNGVYMRPNPAATGIVPASGPFSNSPDIWPAGTSPIGNFQSVLATTQSYASSSSTNLTANMDNYIYVRGCNGTAAAQDRTVALFWARGSVIQWPGMWEDNVIPTDNGDRQANITGVAAGAVAVADQPFLWRSVPPPPSNDHYCLIAQLNDVRNSNPLPKVESQLDMGALVMNNLGFGWRNVTVVAGQQPTFFYRTNLSVPDTMPSTQDYRILVMPVGYKGWYVAFTCSRTDANGNPIQLAKRQILTDRSDLLGGTYALEPGFSAELTVYMYQEGAPPGAPGASVPVDVTYVTASASETLEAYERGLVDWRLEHRLSRMPEDHPLRLRSDGSPQIGPRPSIYLGGYQSQAA